MGRQRVMIIQAADCPMPGQQIADCVARCGNHVHVSGWHPATWPARFIVAIGICTQSGAEPGT
eukprot:14675500-Alexandrium_andersonii.AAC.1